LVSIDPDTGAFTVLEDVSGDPFSWEAMEVIPHDPPGPSSAGEDGPPVGSDPVGHEGAPGVLATMLLRALPNPSSGDTRIVWESGTDVGSGIDILDARGRRVRRLHVGVAAGSAAWDGRDDRGIRVSDGVYFLRARPAGGAVGRVGSASMSPP
jgi:hypothetical protein